MLIAFILGIVVAAFGALLSWLTNSWHISFIFSLTASLISLIIGSMFKNISIIAKSKEKRNIETSQSYKEIEKIASAISAFALPNIIISIILYLKLYR